MFRNQVPCYKFIPLDMKQCMCTHPWDAHRIIAYATDSEKKEIEKKEEVFLTETMSMLCLMCNADSTHHPVGGGEE